MKRGKGSNRENERDRASERLLALYKHTDTGPDLHAGSATLRAAACMLENLDSDTDGDHRCERGAEGALGAGGRPAEGADGGGALEEVVDRRGVVGAQPPQRAPVQHSQPPHPEPPDRAKEPPFPTEPRHGHLLLLPWPRRRHRRRRSGSTTRRSGHQPPRHPEHHRPPRGDAGRRKELPLVVVPHQITAC